MNNLEKIIIFGASNTGKNAFEVLNKKYEVVAFCDNDANKHGAQFCGITVIAPSDLQKDNKIIVASLYYALEIAFQLHNMGCSDISIYKSTNEILKVNPSDLQIFSNFNISTTQREKNLKDYNNFLDTNVKRPQVIVNQPKVNYHEEVDKNILFISYIFPPHGGSGVQRSSKFVKYLKQYGYNPIVVAALDARAYPYLKLDEGLLNDINKDITIIRIDDVYDGMHIMTKNEATEVLSMLDGVIADDNIMSSFLDDVWDVNATKHRITMFANPWMADTLCAIDKLIDFDKIGVIYTTSAPYYSTLIGFFLKHKFNIPWIADFRDEWTNSPVDLHSLPPTEFEVELEKNILSTPDAIIAINAIAANNYMELFGIPSEKIHTITNGYDDDDFPTFIPRDNINKRNKLLIKHGGNPGLLHYGFDITGLFDAINELIDNGNIENNKIEICFIGSIKADMDIIKGLDKHKIATFKPLLPHFEYITEMSESDVLLNIAGDIPSVHRGKIFEYLRMGIPILSLAPKDSVVDVLLQETNAGISFHPSDKVGLSKYIHDSYRAFFDSGIKYTPNHKQIKQYSREALAKRLISVINIIKKG